MPEEGTETSKFQKQLKIMQDQLAQMMPNYFLEDLSSHSIQKLLTFLQWLIMSLNFVEIVETKNNL